MNISKFSFLALALFGAATPAPAAVSLPPIFSDNMVVQHGVPLRIWGTAEPGENISVDIGKVSVGTVKADERGHWEVMGQPQKPGSLPDLVVKGTNTITLKNLLAGEVWLCSGQSNMQMTVSPTPDCEYGGVINESEEVTNANHPEIRFFNKKWEVCSPETVGRASAVAYFFGRALQRELKVPVGLVTKAVGGTAVEFWLAPSSWTGDLTQKAVEAYVPFFQDRQETYKDQLARYERLATDIRAKTKKPTLPVEPEKYPGRFSKLFRENIASVAGYPLAGVLWYQGETNTSRSGAYRELLSALIEGWRMEWKNPDLPFIIVQLTNYETRATHGSGAESWPVVREKQAQVAATMPHTALAVTLGAGDPDLLHPRNKQEVGRRAALRALDMVYRKDLLSEGPTLKSVTSKPPEVVLDFTNADGGMRVEGADQLAMEIAGADRNFRSVKANIKGSTIFVASDGVSEPRWIRYAWANNPRGLLVNREGLVASPFEKPIP